MNTAARRWRLLSENPARRHVERYWLVFTPVWGTMALAVMVSGAAERWGDPELMALGLGFAAGAVVPPVLRPHVSERALPVLARTAFKLGVAVSGLALLMNYFCTPYFFDVLHMHYGFRTELNVQGTPVFLYFMTVAYFATYCVLVCSAYRLCRSLWTGPMRWLAAAVAPMAVAFLETLLNANPFMGRLFCFDDRALMFTFGTLSYGACFMCALPHWLSIDETPDSRVSLGRVVAGLLAAMMAIVIVFEALRHGVAPHVTVVETSRNHPGNCLER